MSHMREKLSYGPGMIATSTFFLLQGIVKIDYLFIIRDLFVHCFVVCRWEPYDPTKSYEKYTIADAKLNFNQKAPVPVPPKVGDLPLVV
jgi:hypothetical protein